jgi:hypothetical protein
LGSEKGQGEFHKQALLGKVVQVSITLTFNNKYTLPSGKVTEKTEKREISVSQVESLSTFLNNLLDEYETLGMLCNHDNIPDKIGGDHGGNSFKVVMQVLNVPKPNSPEHTHLILMAECKDNDENMRVLLEPYNVQIKELKKMQWKGKNRFVHV